MYVPVPHFPFFMGKETLEIAGLGMISKYIYVVSVSNVSYTNF